MNSPFDRGLKPTAKFIRPLRGLLEVARTSHLCRNQWLTLPIPYQPTNSSTYHLEEELQGELEISRSITGTPRRDVQKSPAIRRVGLTQAVELKPLKRGDVERIRVQGEKALRHRNVEEVRAQRLRARDAIGDDDVVDLRHQRRTGRRCSRRPRRW